LQCIKAAKNMTATDILTTLPLTIVVTWACLVLIASAFAPRDGQRWMALLSAAGLVLALVVALVPALNGSSGQPAGWFKTVFLGMAVVDGFAVFMNVLVLLCGLAGIAVAYDYLKRMGLERGEYYALLLFSISGMMLMGMAADLIVVFLSLELLSIPLYILSAFARPRPESEEAGLKYFLLGAYSSGFVVYGIALIFGATATTSLEAIAAALAAGTVNMPLLTIGAGLMLIGFSFKVGAVPFHMWTPDVYEGAPSTIVAFMAVGAKAGGFAAMMRIFITVLPVLAFDLMPVFWGIAALTMILGNIVAIAQTNIKRMLAYSSIAHAGYVLMALVPFGDREVASAGVAAALFYLLAYGLTNFAGWAVVIAMEKAEGQGLRIQDYAGLGRRYPLLAAAMTVAMLSFTGIPPTLGFVGKFFLFQTAIQGGYIGLALIGVLTSLISAYYYLRVVVVMYMQEGDPQARSETWLNVTVGATAIGTVLLTAFAAPLFEWASQAVMRVF
jgi:NADH-quinone oxidoreductase subunit N